MKVIGQKPVRATVSTTNPTLIDLKLKLGVRGGRPVTNLREPWQGPSNDTRW